MQGRLWLFLFAIVAVGALVVAAPMALAQGPCTPFTGTVHSLYYFDQNGEYWLGDASLNIGNQQQHALVLSFMVAPPNPPKIQSWPWEWDYTAGKHKTIAGPTARTVFTFDDGSQIVWAVNETILHQVWDNPDYAALGYVNETAEIERATNAFDGASGHFTLHGPFPFDWDLWTMVFDGTYHGTICGTN